MSRAFRGVGAWGGLTMVLVAGLLAWPAGAVEANQGVSFGPDGLTAEVVGLSRRDGGSVDVSLLVSNRGADDVQSGQLNRSGQRMVTVAVLDPATGKVGDPLGTVDDCRCTELPVFIDAGQQAVTTISVADPGGATLTVLFDAFQPVVGVPVTGAAGAPATTGVRQLQARSMEMLARSKNGAAQVKAKKGVVKGIDLDTDVLFGFDSAKLSGKADAALRKAAKDLKGQPGRRLAVYGHTDGKGSPAYNRDLSLKRARAVQKALAPLLGSGWSFDVQGLGETKPVASEKTDTGADYPAGRRLNRRVELTVQS